ncbi:uncharacterized protein LOC62_02G002650 [Vanrija pseudolonga]|uniref:Uncharacterized protein n=1 Tax=Vanrija pseudolonga TaxID=143232 RepID=A0AAF0Y6F7_9TREE|nr:hypothetical protein LOC62_02G002650 [Vanrija pseudolonga]
MLAGLLFIDMCPNDPSSVYGNCPYMVCYSVVCGGYVKLPTGCGCLEMQTPPNATLISLVKQAQTNCLPSGQTTPDPATATYVPGAASTDIPMPSPPPSAATTGATHAASSGAAGSSGAGSAASPSPSPAAKPSNAGPVVGVSLAAVGALLGAAVLLP